MLASYGGHIELVKWLVEEMECDVNTGSLDGYTPLICAAMKGNITVFNYLKEKGADIFVVNRYLENSTTYAIHNGWKKDSKIKEPLDNRGKVPFCSIVTQLNEHGGPYEVSILYLLDVHLHFCSIACFIPMDVISNEK